MKTIDGLRSALLASIVFSLVPHPASALQPAAVGHASGLYIQESGAGAPLGKLNVPLENHGRSLYHNDKSELSADRG